MKPQTINYQQVFRETPQPTVLLLPDAPRFTIVDVNDAYLLATGTKQTDLLGKGWFEAFPNNPNDLDADGVSNLSRSLHTVIETRSAHTMPIQKYDIPIRNTSGFERRYRNPNNVPVLNDQGEVEFIMHTAIDVTSQELAKNRLAKAEADLVHMFQRYQSLFVHNPQAIYSFDLTGKFLDANNATAQLVETSPEELKQKTFDSFIAPEELARVRGYFEKACTGETQQYTCTILTTSGERRTIRAFKTPMWVEGKIVGVYGIAEDITEMKNAEETARKNQEALQNIMDQSGDIICVLDTGGRFIKVSAAVKKIWGYTPEEVEGKSFTNFIYPDDLEKTFKIREQILAGVHISNFENRYVRKNGTLVPMIWSIRMNAIDGMIYGVARDATEKLEAEKQLVLSERRFKSLVQEGSDLVSVIDTEGKYIYASPNSLIVKHLGPEGYIGRTSFEFIHPEDFLKMRAEFERLKTEKRVITSPFRYRGENGEWRWVVSIATNLLDDPAVGGIVINSHDVTEKLQADKEIRSSEEKYKFMFQLDPMPKWIYDIETLQIIDVNHTAIDHYGYTREEFLSMTIHDIRPESEIPELLKAHTDNMLREGIIRFGIFTHRKKNRELIQVEVAGHLFKHKGRECMMVVCNDVTKRETALQQLQDSNERYKLVSKATSDAVWDWDMMTNRVYWGEGFTTLFGYQLASPVTDISEWSVRIHPDDHDRINQSLEAAVKGTATNWMEEYRYKEANGEYVHVQDKGLILRDETGKAIRMVGALQDITMRKQHEQSLRQLNEQLTLSNEELEQFAYVVSHDLQEPLRMITSFIGLLVKKYGHVIDQQGLKYINFAVDGAKRMRQIILDLLEFSRVGHEEEEMQEVNMNELMDEVQKFYQKKIQQSGARITRTMLPVVKIAHLHIFQLMQNLLSNALKYRREDVPPEISISVREQSDFWEFAFSDNGIGIHPKYFDRVFIIFQRLHTREKYPGTGIGLALCKKIVEHYGGSMWLQSEEGKGSTFYFTLAKQMQ